MIKQNRPQLRFPEFDGEWEVERIGNTCIVNTGGSDTQDRVENGKYPFYVRSNTVERINKFSYDGEAILTSGDGVGVGKNFHYVNEKFDYHQRVYALKEFKDGFNGKFIYQFFSEKFYKRVIKLSAKNSVDSVRMSMITDMPISIPSLPEQRKIASFLTAVDEKIQQLSRKKELLEHYKKGVMQQLFSGKLRFKDDNGKDYPDWEEKKLGEVCASIKSGKSNSSEEGKFPLYGSTGIIGKCIEHSHEGLYILIARVGANAGTINLINDKFGVSDNTLVLNCNQSSFIEYLFHYLSYYNLNRLVFGSGQPLITGGQLKVLNLILPSFSEQQKIANFLSNIDVKIESANQEMNKMQGFKKGLLQQMFV